MTFHVMSSEFWRGLWSAIFARNRDLTPTDDAPPVIPKVARRKVSSSHHGAHYYLGDLLEHMDDAFENMRLMRRADMDAYQACRRVGVSVASSDVLIATNLEPFIARALPSFGFVHHPSWRDDAARGMINMRFSYFIKVKRPGHVAVANGLAGKVYRCGAIWDYRGRPVTVQFFIHVDHQGTAHSVPCMIYKKAKPGFTQRTWGYGTAIEEWAAEHKRSVEEHLRFIFCTSANMAYMREAGITVTCSQGQERVAFAIDMLRSPYFFADREKAVTDNGVTKKILHIVRGHKRTNPDGSQSYVKSHFRGLRKFRWNGYDVRIGVAGSHGAGLSDFNLEALSEHDARADGCPTMGADAVADLVAGKLA